MRYHDNQCSIMPSIQTVHLPYMDVVTIGKIKTLKSLHSNQIVDLPYMDVLTMGKIKILECSVVGEIITSQLIGRIFCT